MSTLPEAAGDGVALTETLLEAASEQDALELLHDSGCTDGLPVLIPTVTRVEQLMSGVDLAADLVLGVMGPKQCAATLEKVAAAAFMAGCTANHFPIVVAAVKAVCREAFDLAEVNQSNHCAAPLLVVNGPARETCGLLEPSAGILGPGNRACASIGRALSLAMINIGGRRTGTTDMACFSTPGKFTACMAEAEDESPFEPFHVSRGFAADDSVVTVISVEAPHSVVLEPTHNAPFDALRLLKCVAGVISNPGSTHVYRGGDGGLAVVFNPEHAALLHRAGYDRARILQTIAEHAVVARDYANALYGGLNRVRGGDDGYLRAIRDPEQIMLIVAGGMGPYSMVLPGWAYAPHGNLPVSEKIGV